MVVVLTDTQLVEQLAWLKAWRLTLLKAMAKGPAKAYPELNPFTEWPERSAS
jgi:hypothetical protein